MYTWKTSSDKPSVLYKSYPVRRSANSVVIQCDPDYGPVNFSATWNGALPSLWTSSTLGRTTR